MWELKINSTNGVSYNVKAQLPWLTINWLINWNKQKVWMSCGLGAVRNTPKNKFIKIRGIYKVEVVFIMGFDRVEIFRLDRVTTNRDLAWDITSMAVQDGQNQK